MNEKKSLKQEILEEAIAIIEDQLKENQRIRDDAEREVFRLEAQLEAAQRTLARRIAEAK
jgi:hypothetical protein